MSYSELTACEKPPIQIIFPAPKGRRRRVITLGHLSFRDSLCSQAEINQMVGERVYLSRDEAERLLHKIADLEQKFRHPAQPNGKRSRLGLCLSAREVFELASGEVFAGVSAVSNIRL